ncbi:MAG: hypothetical protein Q9208_001924 [Pyrenodesmia sp. 3 TL-2023]
MGVIYNRIAKDAMGQYVPILKDALGNLSQEGLREFSKSLDDFSHQAKGYITPYVFPNRHPGQGFVAQRGGLPKEGSNKVNGSQVPPMRLPGTASQKKAIEPAINYLDSLMHGLAVCPCSFKSPKHEMLEMVRGIQPTNTFL